jgi:hypothetical protein
VSLRKLYEQFRDYVEFLAIYVREAHPVDGWHLGRPDIVDPITLEERREAAGQCIDAMNHGIRTYVDDMDDAVSIAYAAWPNRLYLIDVDGRVVYAGGRGPFGYKPKQLKKAIDTLLDSQT